MEAAVMACERLPLGAHLLRALWWTLVGALWLVAVLVAARRLDGALDQPLSGSRLLTIVAGLVALAAAIRFLAAVVAAGDPARRRPGLLGTIQARRKRLLAHLAPLPAVVVLVLALVLPATSTAAWTTAWLLLMASESLELWALLSAPLPAPRSWRAWWRGTEAAAASSSRVAEPSRPAAQSPAEPSFAQASAAGAAETTLLEIDHDHETPGITQHWSRGTLDNGGQWIEGWQQVPLVAGQRVAVVHVPFCPPLPGVPQVTGEVEEGPAARIRLAQVLPHGVRIELRVTDAPQEDTLAIVSCRAEWSADDAGKPQG